jgi:outer membrane receptor protein involved in Fe transport
MSAAHAQARPGSGQRPRFHFPIGRLPVPALRSAGPGSTGPGARRAGRADLRRGIVLFLLLGAVAGRARADSGADEAEARFRLGTSHFRAGRYDTALVEFFASQRLAPNRNVVFNIARSYEALGHLEEAYRYYVEYLAQEASPRDRELTQRRLEELAPRVALVRVETSPPGATVYVDRKDLGGRGTTPLLLAYEPGRHEIFLEAPGHRPARVAVELTRGQEAVVSVPLELVVGTLHVASRPAAQIYVDRTEGESRRPDAVRTPALLRLPPGRHTLELHAPGHRVRRSEVVITADQETRIDVALEVQPPPSGTVVLTANVPGALVTVDGVASGFTPAVLNLPIGNHEISVAGAGLRPWVQQVAVARDDRRFYDVVLEEAEQEVVGATRQAQPLSSAPASVTVVDESELWAFGYDSLAEAMRAVRGLYHTDDRSYEAIGIRGFSRPGDYTNRVLVNRDGHAMNDNWVGSGTVGRDFAASLSDVSRIEVVRGPGSTFYGPGAFFGVLNVVSLAPGAGPPVSAGGSVDSQGGGNAFARASLAGKRAQLSLHAAAHDSAGRTLHFEELAGDEASGDIRDADGENAQRVALRAHGGGFALDAGYSRRRKQLPTAPFATVPDPARHLATDREVTRVVDRRGYAELRWEHGRGPVELGARLAYDHQRYDGVYPYDDGMSATILADAGDGDWTTGELRTALRFLGQRLTLGGEVSHHAVTQAVDEDSDDVAEFSDEHRFWNSAVYAVDELALGQWLTISAGARLDRFGEQKAVALSPRLGAVLRPYRDAWTKFVVGRALRAPSVYELYYNDDGLTQRAPDSLDPEIIWTAELEHTHTLGRRSYLLGSVFTSRIERLINLGSDEDGILVFGNASDTVRSTGGELEARYTTARDAWLGASLSVTHLAADDMAVRINSAGAVAALRGFWPVLGRRFGLAAEFLWNSPRQKRDGSDTEPALLGSLTASGELGDSGLRYRVGVNNLLDWNWSMPLGEEHTPLAVAQPGRSFAAQLVYAPR